MSASKFSKSDYIFLLIIFIAFYLLYRFSVFTSDDYYYSFISGFSRFYSSDTNGVYIPINSIADAIESQMYDYMHWNGRFIVHTLTSYFCGVTGLDIFRILNSIVFVLLITGLIKLIRSEFGYNKTDKYIILFLLFVLMPNPGEIFLAHIAFVINYLWVSCAIVHFILLYNKIKNNKKYNIGINILLLFTGLIIGSLQESFTIGISGALFIYYCYNFRKFRGSVTWLVIGFWIGTSIVTLAPGNFTRLEGYIDENRFSGLIKYINSLAHLIFDLKLLLIYLIISIILYFKDKPFIINFTRKNHFYLLGIFFNGIIITMVYTGTRQLTCIELFSMILLIKIIYSYSFNLIEKKGIIINMVISLFLISIYIPIYKDRNINHTRYENLHKKEPNNGTIVDKDFLEKGRYLKKRTFIFNYIYYYFNNDFIGLSIYKTNGKNPKAITAILPITQEEIEKKFDNNNNVEYIYDKKNLAYYLRCPKDKSIDKLYFLAESTTTLGKIRNKLFNEGLNRIKVLSPINTFHTSDYKYFTIYDPGFKVHDFEIIYK